MRKPIDRLSGSITALATPFRDGRIDEAAQVALVERQILRGTAALVVCGSTGEAAMLSLAEHAHNVRLVVSVAAGRVPVIAGCTAQATADACALAVAAVRAGADGLLLAPPPYVKPTQLGIIAHTTAVARAADLPIVLYDVPSRVGVAIADTTVANLSDAGHVIAVKDATGDLSRPPRLRDLCGPGLLQFTGEDSLAGAYRAMGGHGCISVTANVAPAACAAFFNACLAGDWPAARSLQDKLVRLHKALFLDASPSPAKFALARLGLCEEACRLPILPCAEIHHAEIIAAMDEAGVAA